VMLFLCALVSFFGEERWAHSLFENVPLLQYLPLFIAGIFFFRIHHSEGKNWFNYSLVAATFFCQWSLFKYTGRLAFLSGASYAAMLALFYALFILFVNGYLVFAVSGPAVFLGEISYALYLIHQFISVNILLPLCVNVFGINYWISVLITLAVVILIAAIITRFVERPARTVLRTKLKELLGIVTIKQSLKQSDQS
jgi:peptidoglycan/LPS O-acetylase OafA/YrhL